MIKITNSDIICEIRSGNEHPEQIVKDAGIYVRNILNKKHTFNVYCNISNLLLLLKYINNICLDK